MHFEGSGGFVLGALLGFFAAWLLRAGWRADDSYRDAERAAALRIHARRHEFLAPDWGVMHRIMHGISRREIRVTKPIRMQGQGGKR